MMRFLRNEEGQGLTEYALLLAFVALIVVVVLYVLGPAVGDLYQTIVDGWQAAVG
jgi:pilus assembly protein Flp/PilA